MRVFKKYFTVKLFKGKVVLKWTRQGYDGKGTFLFHSKRDLSRAIAFCKKGLAEKSAQVYAEAWIPFRRELALVSCANEQEQVFYPLVVTEQENGMCRRVSGPATQCGVSPQLEKQAQRMASQMAQELGILGAFAVEFFETRAGRLLVNEIAPRVHNSGHFSMNACPTSQFENHLRGVLGMPLGDTQANAGFAMLNLITPVGSRRTAIPEASHEVHLHWYGKREFIPGRKLGHLNAVASGKSSISLLFKQLMACEKEWIQQCRLKK